MLLATITLKSTFSFDALPMVLKNFDFAAKIVVSVENIATLTMTRLSAPEA